MGEKKSAYKVWQENMKDRHHQQDRGIGGMIIVQWNLKEQNGRKWTVFIWLRIGTTDRLI
jgi:hypothetical protein